MPPNTSCRLIPPNLDDPRSKSDLTGVPFQIVGFDEPISVCFIDGGPALKQMLKSNSLPADSSVERK
jgi:hypothetical protein